LAEWHVTPDYIVNNWTEELLNLMVDKLVERKQMYISKGSSGKVSDTELFARTGNVIKVVKKG